MLAKSPKVTLYTGGSDGFVTSTAAPIATEWNEPVLGREFHPLWTSAFHGAQHSSTIYICEYPCFPSLWSRDSTSILDRERFLQFPSRPRSRPYRRAFGSFYTRETPRFYTEES